MLGKLHTLVILPISLWGEYNIELIISTRPVLPHTAWANKGKQLTEIRGRDNSVLGVNILVNSAQHNHYARVAC